MIFGSGSSRMNNRAGDRMTAGGNGSKNVTENESKKEMDEVKGK